MRMNLSISCVFLQHSRSSVEVPSARTFSHEHQPFSKTSCLNIDEYVHFPYPYNVCSDQTIIQLDGAKAMKPNFHWAVHLEEQIRDFGPVYNFWTFLSERLNKLLKSSNSNNWTTGGPLEISMMRKFIRGIRMDALVSMPSLT
jgi:hypothetical protein